MGGRDIGAVADSVVVARVISTLWGLLLEGRARRVEAVSNVLIACRVVKVDPAPIRSNFASRFSYGPELFAYALIDERGIERDPLSVAEGLRAGRVVALVGFDKLPNDEIGSDLKDAAGVALERARTVAEFTK